MTWTPQASGGYMHTLGAKLSKQGKNWVLEHRGKTVQLPKKASFDHAERAMAEIVRAELHP
jgi:hypothetical protein